MPVEKTFVTGMQLSVGTTPVTDTVKYASLKSSRNRSFCYWAAPHKTKIVYVANVTTNSTGGLNVTFKTEDVVTDVDDLYADIVSYDLETKT